MDYLLRRRYKMVEYGIVAKYELDAFIKAVNEKLKQGWKLQGGVTTSWHVPFYQAIYREVEV